MNKRYTEEQLAFIRAHSKLPHKELAILFNKEFGIYVSGQSMSQKCHRMGWRTGRTGRFEKGCKPNNTCFKKEQKPWNTGTKGLTEKNKGCFRKGCKPHNYSPIGSTRTLEEGYIQIKVADPDKWRFLHHIAWERHHGKLENGYIVRFKDNNRQNCTIDNLEMVKRNVHFRLNKMDYAKYPAEIKPSVKALAELEVKIFEKCKNSTKKRSVGE